MKTTLFFLTTLVLPLHSQVTGKIAFRDAATNASLTEKYRQASLADPMKVLPQTQGKDPSVATRVNSLLEDSDLITYNGRTTLVPKNALVIIPKKLAERINKHKEGSEIVSWLDFFSQNRGWISTVEVTFAQAKGEQPVSSEVMETLGKSGNLIVAVLKRGPISVMPPKPDPTETPIQTAKTQQL